MQKRSGTPGNRVEPPEDHRPDRGVTLIEILISIVLLGTVVSATLTALIAVITATSADRDQANAHAWLQTGADMLYARDLKECDDTADPTTEINDTIAAYELTVQQTDNPEGWSPGNIQVTGLEWWSIDVDPITGLGTEAWGTFCQTDITNLQRVTLRVTSETGKTIEEVEVIIGE